jgi:excisionase family DNA binding protein
MMVCLKKVGDVVLKEQDIANKGGELSGPQNQEIGERHFLSTKQIAGELNYSMVWITKLVQQGRIKGIKPTGGSWRVPASEVDRIKKEGIPPLPRAAPTPMPEEIVVKPEHLVRVTAQPKEKKEKQGEEEEHWPFNILIK